MLVQPVTLLVLSVAQMMKMRNQKLLSHLRPYPEGIDSRIDKKDRLSFRRN
jgi:hypothetical protein